MKRIVSFVMLLCLVSLLSAALAEPEIIVPEEYTQAGTLPIYSAIPQDFNAVIKPEMFNQSGVVSQSEGRHHDHEIVFADEATLHWYADPNPESIFYAENSGTYDVNAGTEYAPEFAPRPALSNTIESLASMGMFFYGDSKLEKTELAHISLDEAKAALETLFKQLNISGYVCDYALDISVERIQTLVGETQARIASGQLTTNILLSDLSKATAADEGYYLSYHKPCETYAQGNVGQFGITAYVTERGVVYASIRDQYIQGEVYDTPEALLSPDDVLALLPGEVETSRVPSTVVSVSTLRLIYTPRRASNKADGMVLTPSWYIAYQTPDAEKNGYDCFAIFDAIDGTLLDATFN